MLTKQHALTALINTLSAIPRPDVPASNPLRHLAHHPRIKPTFFSLHVLCPTSLLAALDLLDRGMVHRVVLSPSPVPHPSVAAGPSVPLLPPPGPEMAPPTRAAYRVASSLGEARSGSWRRHRGHAPPYARPGGSIAARLHAEPAADEAGDDEDDDENDDGSEGARAFHHAVNLRSWTCSCPAFAFALFPAARDGRPPPRTQAERADDEAVHHGWRAGGLLRPADEVPVCKHLLACLLVERCPGLFGAFVREQEVGVEGWVGWAAGWGA